MKELALMKGNEAIAEAAIRAGVDGYFGYPITPQSEVMEYLMLQKPEERTGMVVLQAESELAAINMVFGAAYSFMKRFELRGGYKINYDEERFTFGAGLCLPLSGTILKIDYSYADFNRLQTTHQFSLSFNYSLN